VEIGATPSGSELGSGPPATDIQAVAAVLREKGLVSCAAWQGCGMDIRAAEERGGQGRCGRLEARRCGGGAELPHHGSRHGGRLEAGAPPVPSPGGGAEQQPLQHRIDARVLVVFLCAVLVAAELLAAVILPPLEAGGIRCSVKPASRFAHRSMCRDAEAFAKAPTAHYAT